MNLDLTDKVAFITGVSSGIGAATAEVFAEEGTDVVVAYDQDRDSANQCKKVVESKERRAWLCQMDIRQPEAVLVVVERLKVEIGRVDILVLCAGYNVVTPFQEITPKEWDKVVSINLSGVFY